MRIPLLRLAAGRFVDDARITGVLAIVGTEGAGMIMFSESENALNVATRKWEGTLLAISLDDA